MLLSNPIGSCRAPTFSPVAGAYTTVQTVTIGDATSGTIIYYTTNGTIPTGNSSVYVAAISVSSTETLQAIAMATGYTTSAVATAVYAINNSVPVISSLSPAANSAGGTAFTLTVNGSGFSLSSTVYWGTPPSPHSTGTIPTYGSGHCGRHRHRGNHRHYGADSSTGRRNFQRISVRGGFCRIRQYLIYYRYGYRDPRFDGYLSGDLAQRDERYRNMPESSRWSYLQLFLCNQIREITTSPTTPAGTYQITVVFTLTEAGSATGVILLPFLGLPIVLRRRRMAARGAWVAACLGLILLAGTAVGCVGGSAATHKVTSSSIITLMYNRKELKEIDL